jgi:hypothetical protein
LLDFYGILWYFMAENGTVWHKKAYQECDKSVMEWDESVMKCKGGKHGKG